MQGVVGSSPISSTTLEFSMADIAQLVRAPVCGTGCRRFESGYPPQLIKKRVQRACFFINPGRVGFEPEVRLRSW